MHGKLKFKFLLLVTLLLSGCQNVIQDSQKEIVSYMNITPIEDKKISEFSKESIDSLLNNAVAITYPNDTYFIPTYLDNEQRLIGQVSAKDGNIFLATYDLFTYDFNRLKKVDGTKGYTSIRVIYSDENYLLFEELDQKVQTSKLYTYKYKNEEILNIKTISDIPPISYSQAAKTDDGVILNLYNPETKQYSNYIYSFYDNELKIIEDRNCGFPVYKDKKLYYVLIENQNGITKLVEYSFESKRKQVLYETKSQESYISGIYSDGEKIYTTIHSNMQEDWFLLDSKNELLKYEFSTDLIESVQFKKGHLSWVGTPKIENRVRLEYYLFNIDQQIAYTNDNGMILLSDNGLVCITYKKDDVDIPKGEMYLDENTYISFYSFDTVLKEESEFVGVEKQENENSDSNRINIYLEQSIQENEYYCSPACAQMLFKLHNIHMSQKDIASEMNTVPITGTEYVDFTRVINKYIFGKETILDYEPGYRVQSGLSDDYYPVFEQRVKTDIKSGDPLFVAIEVSKLYPELNVYGNHMIVITGFSSNAEGNINYYYFVDPSYLVQDEVFKGLKFVSASELKNAMLSSEEPAYIW